jgi:hypothetical protein
VQWRMPVNVSIALNENGEAEKCKMDALYEECANEGNVLTPGKDPPPKSRNEEAEERRKMP